MSGLVTGLQNREGRFDSARYLKKTVSAEAVFCFHDEECMIYRTHLKNYRFMVSQYERKSIRKYSNKDIDDELLESLIDEALHTQTMGNLQLYSVVITRSMEMKAKLAPAHFNQPMVTEAPVVLTICADFNRTTRWCEERKAQPGYDNFLSFMNAATDALLFTQTLCNLAEEKGLGYCFLGTTIYMPQPIINILKLPKLVMPVATITLGWPDENPNPSDRLPKEAIIHKETYKDYSKQDIDNYYHKKENLEESKEFCRINHKETLAQIFTDIRYTRNDNEQMSTSLLEALKNQGFIN